MKRVSLFLLLAVIILNVSCCKDENHILKSNNLLVFDEDASRWTDFTTRGLIDKDSAYKYINSYKNDFLEKEAAVKDVSGNLIVVKLKDILLPKWCETCDTAARVSFNVPRAAIENLLKQTTAQNIIIYPAMRQNMFTNILLAADSLGMPIMRSTTSGTINSTSGYLIYDEIRPCPPPIGCKIF